MQGLFVWAFEFVHHAMSVHDNELMYSKKAVYRKIQMTKMIDFVIGKLFMIIDSVVKKLFI